ncbi:transmembrane protein 267-like [Oppia nitens]|uniref:transmembrane protein 267-like n=1 Tax=Oppia nitens TaxID=1686743 RepID=UPI0023DB8150|nr:transmembrane protein 267-like [Oppia nitens]
MTIKSNQWIICELKYLSIASSLLVISIFGDHLLSIKRTPVNSYVIALTDTLIHGMIASLSWLLVAVTKGQPIYENIILIESLLAFMTASAIDFDHVLEARSFDLKIVSQLSDRPFLHNTSLMLSISLSIIAIGLLRHNWLIHTYGWIFLTAIFTHHLRDAIRHGFWFYPFHTKPVPQWLYVLTLTSFPLICSLLMNIVAKEWLERHSINDNIKYQAMDLNLEEV